MEPHCLYQAKDLKVSVNSSDDVFVTYKDVQLRISPNEKSLVCTAGNGKGNLSPWAVNGLAAFVVYPPHKG